MTDRRQLLVEIDTWTPGRVVEALERGWLLPEDWREILEASQYEWSDDERP